MMEIQMVGMVGNALKYALAALMWDPMPVCNYQHDVGRFAPGSDWTGTEWTVGC